MQMVLVAFVTALLVEYTITAKYLHTKQYGKFILYTTLINLPIAFAANAMVSYIRGQYAYINFNSLSSYLSYWFGIGLWTYKR